MRVLIYAPSAIIGGVEVWSFTYFRQLMQQGIATILFSAEPGVLVDSLSITEKRYLVVGSFAELICYLKYNQVDVVHFPSQAIDDGAGFIKKLFPKIKVIVTCHGAIPTGWSSNNCDQIISCAAWLSCSASVIAGVNVPHICNGVDEKSFHFNHEIANPERPILLWVGRADDPVKNFVLFLTLVDDIKALGMDIWVVSATTKEQLAENNLEGVMGKIDKWLSLSYGEMAYVYQYTASSGGALLMTSLREGLPMVAIEAQACGCPLVGPSHSGIFDAQINKQLLFHSLDNKIEILEKINEVINRTNEINTFGEALSLKTIKKFSVEKMSFAYLESYKIQEVVRSKVTLFEKFKRFITILKYENIYFRKNIFNSLQLVISNLKQSNERDLAQKLRLIQYKYLIFK